MTATFAGRAVADEPAAPPTDMERAIELFDRAEADKRIGDDLAAKGDHAAAEEAYRRAAEGYLQAYYRTGRAELLFNLAQVYRLRGDKRKALEMYRKYLELVPDGAAAATARTWAETLAREIAEDDAIDKPPAREPVPAPAPAAKPAPAPAATPGPAPAPALLPAPVAQPTPPATDLAAASDVDRTGSRPGRGLRIGGVAVGAAGLLALGYGIKVGLDARAASDDLSAHDTAWTETERRLADDGARSERRMVLSCTVGGVALATGALLYYVGHRRGRRGERSRVGMTVTPGAGGAALVFSGEL